MVYIIRKIEPQLKAALGKGYSILLLGPRQTGKTTLLKKIESDLLISLIQPRVRRRYEMDPSLLSDEIETLSERMDKKPLVIVDEIQKVPDLMDVAQDLIDNDVAQLILTGSSARKLKRNKNINLLPGRVIPLHLSPLTQEELPTDKKALNDILTYGTLPKIVTTESSEDKTELLDAYVNLYLEEEVRAEALVRNLANFSRFLELAASESGYTVNYSKLSQIIGVSHTTIADYYQILEDCLIAHRIEPLISSKTRHKLCKSSKFLMFDLGVRRLAANEGENYSDKLLGHIFEQYVGLELVRMASLSPLRINIKFWCDLDGPEVDWVVEAGGMLIPIEVKYNETPKKSDAKHLKTFISEYKEASVGYVVCRTPREIKLDESIYAIPWDSLARIFSIF